MKKQLLLLIAFLGSLSLSAQTETLLNNADYGGFGGPFVHFSEINGTLVGDVGGGGGLTINNFFVGGYGLGTNGATIDIQDQIHEIDFDHGGFWLGYAFNQHKLVHVFSSFKVGWGDVELKYDGSTKSSNNILAIEPELGFELNVTSWFKLGLTGGYRVVSGVDSNPYLSDKDFTSPFGAVTFRFGGFSDDWGGRDDDFDF